MFNNSKKAEDKGTQGQSTHSFFQQTSQASPAAPANRKSKAIVTPVLLNYSNEQLAAMNRFMGAFAELLASPEAQTPAGQKAIMHSTRIISICYGIDPNTGEALNLSTASDPESSTETAAPSNS